MRKGNFWWYKPGIVNLPGINLGTSEEREEEVVGKREIFEEEGKNNVEEEWVFFNLKFFIQNITCEIIACHLLITNDTRLYGVKVKMGDQKCLKIKWMDLNRENTKIGEPKI